MKNLSIIILAILSLGLSSCYTMPQANNRTTISGDSNRMTPITSPANQPEPSGKTDNDRAQVESSSVFSEITHPVFDIRDFDKYSFDDTSQRFDFNVKSAVSKEDGRNTIKYLLIITPKINESIDNIVVTASLDPKWLEILTDKNRNNLYFGTNKVQPFSMKKGSESEKGLISEIGKYLPDDILPEMAKDYLKLPVKIVIKYNNKTSSFLVPPSKIFLLGQEVHP